MSQTLFIDGQWVGAKSGDTRDIINPFNQEVIATVSEGSRNDAQLAIKAARKTFDQGDWANMPGLERGNIVFKIAELIRRDLDELAKLESLDTGKTLEESKADMDDIANVFQYYAGLADKDGGEIIASPIPRTCRCMRSNHSLELSIASSELENRSCPCSWKYNRTKAK